MLFFSKSKYCEFKQCPKASWLHRYKPEVREVDAATEARFAKGNEVGDLAMGLFGDFVEATAYKPDGSLDLQTMKELTKQYLKEGREVICEAAFDYKGLYCAVDILRKTANGYAVYEVKSSTHPDKYVYILDVCYQKYVLQKLGIPIDGTYIVTVNSEYVFDGTLDIGKLFQITDVSALVDREIGMVEEDLKRAEEVLASKEEPKLGLSLSCTDPYDCPYWNYCTRELPKPSVFDLYRIRFETALELYRRGIVSFEDALRANVKLNEKMKRQIEFALGDKGTYVDREAVKSFLSTLSYPLYFLDFETMQPVVPQYAGTRPYQQITFQYSLHYLEEEGGELRHKEFLAESGPDPRRALAERLAADIPGNVCVLAYNKAFECSRIKELANAFPDLASHLLKIERNIKDLLDPFQKGYYYNRGMGGSFSIKSVLPAIYPDDPALNYHNLEGVHNGSEAMEIFPKIKGMPQAEREAARRNLLEYCKLDTLAMVKVWQELINCIK